MSENSKPVEQDEFLQQIFQRERELAMAESRPPDPMLIYRKAVAEERRRTYVRAMRPIFVVERVAYLLAAALAIVLLAWSTPELDWSWIAIPTQLPSLTPMAATLLFGVSLILFVGWIIFTEE